MQARGAERWQRPQPGLGAVTDLPLLCFANAHPANAARQLEFCISESHALQRRLIVDWVVAEKLQQAYSWMLKLVLVIVTVVNS